MPKLTLLPEQRTVELEAGTVLLDGGNKAGVAMESGCLGCSCGTCTVEVVEGIEHLSTPTDDELEVLDQWNRDSNRYRLACVASIQGGDVVVKRVE